MVYSGSLLSCSGKPGEGSNPSLRAFYYLLELWRNVIQMTAKEIAEGVVHEIPADLRKALSSDSGALVKWNDITPLARNEWICWTISVKTPAVRADHVRRVCSELKQGMRRPCCWIGCIHRTDKAISPSIKGILSKRNKSKK